MVGGKKRIGGEEEEEEECKEEGWRGGQEKNGQGSRIKKERERGGMEEGDKELSRKSNHSCGWGYKLQTAASLSWRTSSQMLTG